MWSSRPSNTKPWPMRSASRFVIGDASIRPDGRVLASGDGPGRGALGSGPWRGTRIPADRIPRYPLFEASGDLLTVTSGRPRRSAVAGSARSQGGGIPRRPAAPPPVASSRSWAISRGPVRSNRGRSGFSTSPHVLDSGSNVPAWARWMTAAMSRSARTVNGWRPAATARTAPRSGGSPMAGGSPI